MVRCNVLDHGYVDFVESWGSDERIIEAARMSTDKGFQGWGGDNCKHCGAHRDSENLLTSNACNKPPHAFSGTGDEKLLRYLWTHKHFTPFEMAGMSIEIQAPIFVVREWHRHRTQSYNELSARYTELPDLYYLPSVERLMAGKQAKKNKQSSEEGFSLAAVGLFRTAIERHVALSRRLYEDLLGDGMSRELARIVIPLNQYTRFRASANLRNWLQFLQLRLDSAAQWEIRQYAQAVAGLIQAQFPRTYALFEEDNGAVSTVPRP